jgi:VanZ family protein
MDRVWDVARESLVPIAIFVLVVGTVLFLIRRRSGRSIREAVSVSFVDALLVSWGVGLVLVTLGDWHWEGRQLDLVPFRSISAYLSQWNETTVPATQLLGNVLLFLPFGLLAPARFRSLRPPLALLGATVILAVTIEALQFVTAQGRVASTDDVILAVVGAAVGWIANRAITALASGSPVTERTSSRASPGSSTS